MEALQVSMRHTGGASVSAGWWLACQAAAPTRLQHRAQSPSQHRHSSHRDLSLRSTWTGGLKHRLQHKAAERAGLHSVRCVAAIAPAAESQASSKQQAQELVRWLKENGALDDKSRVTVEETPYGLGLVATQDISEKSTVVSVPEKLCLNIEAARASSIGQFCDGLRPWLVVALFLLKEMNDPNSFWQPYLHMLPRNLDSPIYWTDEELSLLQGSQLLSSAEGYRDYVRSEFDQLQAGVFAARPDLFDSSTFTYDNLLWAFGILRSRVFPPLDGDNIALVPLVDLANHGETSEEAPQITLKSAGMFARSNVVTLTVTSSYKSGEQVLINYGDKSNTELVLDHGFVTNSTERDRYSLTCEVPENDRFFDDKADICESVELGSSIDLQLIRGQEPPEDLLPFLRLANLSGADAFHLEPLFRSVAWQHVIDPVSEINEAAVCDGMIEGCTQALAAYPNSIEEDEQWLKTNSPTTSSSGNPQYRQMLAVRARYGEKVVLRDTLNFFQLRRQDLLKLEFYAERRLKGLGLMDEGGASTFDEGDITSSELPREHQKTTN
eukprot:jgi/Chlat1/4138/Chrsp269S00809